MDAERGERLVVFGQGGGRRRRRGVSDAAHRWPARGPRQAAACDARLRDDRDGAPRRRLALGGPLLPALTTDRLFLVVFPDERALRGLLQRHGHVEAEAEERDEKQASKPHPGIVPAAG